MSSPKVGGPDP